MSAPSKAVHGMLKPTPLLLIGVGICVAIFVISRSNKIKSANPDVFGPKPAQGKLVDESVTGTSYKGVLVINKKTWTRLDIPPGKRSRTWAITKGVARHIRSNGGQSYPLPLPAGVSLGDDVTLLEWKIDADQRVESAEIGYEIIPNK
jgi:hypothetical protein